MNLAARELYTSITFWTVVGVGGTLVTAMIAWVTMRVAIQKRQLFYGMQERLPQDGEVRHAGQLLSSPHVVNIGLISMGMRDISREAFDGGEPLRLDVGAKIIKCGGVATSPSSRPDPAWMIDGSALLIGPSLIGRRQTMGFSLLIDGRSAGLSDPKQTLIDVDIRPIDHASGGSSLRAAALVWILIAVVIYIVLKAPSLAVYVISLPFRLVTGLFSGAGIGVALIAALYRWWYRPRWRSIHWPTGLASDALDSLDRHALALRNTGPEKAAMAAEDVGYPTAIGRRSLSSVVRRGIPATIFVAVLLLILAFARAAVRRLWPPSWSQRT